MLEYVIVPCVTVTPTASNKLIQNTNANANTPTPSHAQIRFVFSPSPALLAMIPQATPVPQFPFLVDFTAYSNYMYLWVQFSKLTVHLLEMSPDQGHQV